jgi:hypothetical protein
MRLESAVGELLGEGKKLVVELLGHGLLLGWRWLVAATLTRLLLRCNINFEKLPDQ